MKKATSSNSINRLPIEQVEVSERRLLLPTNFVGTIIAGATTPSIKNVEKWKLVNVAPVTITNFLDGQDGQDLVLLGDGFTTIENNTFIKTNTGADKLLNDGYIYRLTRFDSIWYEM